VQSKAKIAICLGLHFLIPPKTPFCGRQDVAHDSAMRCISATSATSWSATSEGRAGRTWREMVPLEAPPKSRRQSARSRVVQQPPLLGSRPRSRGTSRVQSPRLRRSGLRLGKDRLRFCRFGELTPLPDYASLECNCHPGRCVQTRPTLSYFGDSYAAPLRYWRPHAISGSMSHGPSQRICKMINPHLRPPGTPRGCHSLSNEHPSQ
jgi:hypothetical protein